MRIAVIGATGLVGAQVVRAAAAGGHDVLAVVRRRGAVPPATGGPRPRTAVAALTDVETLAAAVRGSDALVHCAAVYAFGSARAREVAEVNREGTATVLEAAARAGVPRVVVTSSSVTCGSATGPQLRDETSRLAAEPTPAYYTSKVAQEEAALAAGARLGLDVVLALPAVVLGGPYRRLGPSNAIVLRYLLDATRSTFPGGCTVVDARDVGDGHVLLAERGRAGERYLLGGEEVTWRMLHGLVSELAGLPGPYAELGGEVAWLAAAAAEGWARLTGGTPLSTREEASTVGRYYWYSSAKAAALGYSPRPARAAVAASLAHLLAGRDVPRWVREGLRVHPEVRVARPLLPRPLPADARAAPAGDPPAVRPAVRPAPRRSRPPAPRPRP